MAFGLFAQSPSRQQSLLVLKTTTIGYLAVSRSPQLRIPLLGHDQAATWKGAGPVTSRRQLKYR